MTPENDFHSCCVDEIALEGLDGITIQALWVRLQLRPNFPFSLDNKSKAFIWNSLVRESRLSFYTLGEPRIDLVIYDRYKHVDPNSGYVVEPSDLPPDPYPFKLINKNGLLGSCSTFDSRADVSDEIRGSSPALDDVVARWGNRLVIVADQITRARALIGPNNTLTDLDLTEMKYCILERIGRSRYLGQTTQGRQDLRVFNLTHSSMFILRKQLVQRNLITKQEFSQRAESGGNRVGFLLHLPRFFVEVKTKSQVMARELCALLATKPNRREVPTKLFDELGLTYAAGKKLLHGTASKYVTRRTVLYSEFYPDAPREEWYTKNNKPRSLRVCELVKSFQEEEEEEEDAEGSAADKNAGLFFHPQKYVYDMPRLDQAYREVYKAGTAGMTLRELCDALMATRLEVRNLQKGLIRRKLVMPYRVDLGKQRVIRYFCHEFAAKSEVHQKLAVEKKRMLEQPRVEPVPAKKQKTTDTPSPVGLTEDTEGQEERKQAIDEDRAISSAPARAGTPVGTSEASEKMEEAEKSVGSSPPCSVTSDNLAESSSDALAPEQPTITVETNSECFFPKVSTRDSIRFPSLSEVVNRKPLQKLLPSYRMLARANRIIEYVQAERLCSDFTKLLKALQKAEEEEGSTMKLDKVSVERLITKLCNGGYLKTIHTVLRLGKNVKDLKLICMPSVTKDDEVVKAAIEQAKFKYFHSAPKEPKKPVCSPVPEPSPCSKMTYNPAMGRYYGVQPKFRKMHLFYAFMHYLLHSYDGVAQERLSDDPSIPTRYHDEVCWKMFVPPLSNSPTTPEGWVLFADVLLSLPLSLFVKIASSIRHKIEGLEEYLHDEVKCHYLIRSLPVKLRNALLFARRYIYSIHDTVKRLAYVGMVTFGPQRLKEKDQVFLFLHRNLRIKDTKISQPGYHQISADIDYTIKKFFLKTQHDVDHFWLEVENTCICTPLGIPQSIQGQTIELQNLYKKPAMIEAVRNREFGEEKDDGTVPGDQLGAAGFDSALFAHLKRNWTCPDKMPVKLSTSNGENKRSNSDGPKPLQKLLDYLDQASRNTGTAPSQKQSQKRARNGISRITVYYPKEPDGKPLAVPVVKGATKDAEEQPKKKAGQKKKSDITVRIIQPRKQSTVRKPYYDDKDKAALKEMKTMRVSWSSQEDIVLLMCKVCSWFLDRHQDKMVVPFTVIRDILNERFPQLSKDKTSRACQRRLRFIMLNPATRANASVFLCEAEQDQQLMEMFHGPKPVKSDEKQWVSMFRTVLDHVMKKFSKSAEQRYGEVTLPTSFGELRDRYELIVPHKMEMDSWSYAEPHNIVDIHFSSVAMVILASLAADDGKTSWSLILYKIYEQYPDSLVRSVTARLRHNCMICRKNQNAKKLYISLNLSMLPFTLSSKFQFDMTRRFSPEHVIPMGKLLLELLSKRRRGESYTFQDFIEPAYTPLLFTLMLTDKLSYSMEVPQAIVHFDSSMTVGKAPQRKADTGTARSTVSLVEESPESGTRLASKAKSLNFETAGCNAKTSRSFLYMLRQDMTNALQYNNLRPQDYVVIKSCKLDFLLTNEDLIPGWTLEDPTDKSYALKVRNPLYDKIVQEQRVFYSLEATKHCWTAEDIVNAYREAGKSLEEAQLGTEVYFLILKKEQLGVTYTQLFDTLSAAMSSTTLDAQLGFLVESKVILRVGVTCIRYVALQHCKPWVIRTFKIPKDMRAYTSSLGDEEHVLKAKVKKVAATDDVSMSESEAKKPAEGAVDAGGTTTGSCITSPEPSMSCAQESPSRECREASSTTRDGIYEIGWKNSGIRRARDSISNCLKRTYYEAVTKNINIESFEKILYIPRLWRKPDGTLNRPVLLQLMSAVLSYILDNPGVTEDDFKAKFSHKIEPCVQTLEVLRILEQMNCIRRYFLRPDTTAKSSLFSKRRRVVACDTYCLGDIICYEGTLDALVNFAAFSVYFQK